MSGPSTQLTSAAFTLICPATQHRMSSKHQLTGPEKHCAGKALTSTPILPALEQDLWYFLICPDPEKQVSEGLARIGLWEDLAWSPHFYLQVSCISRDYIFFFVFIGRFLTRRLQHFTEVTRVHQLLTACDLQANVQPSLHLVQGEQVSSR
jgi:hypothetical protein